MLSWNYLYRFINVIWLAVYHCVLCCTTQVPQFQTIFSVNFQKQNGRFEHDIIYPNHLMNKLVNFSCINEGREEDSRKKKVLERTIMMCPRKIWCVTIYNSQHITYFGSYGIIPITGKCHVTKLIINWNELKYTRIILNSIN